LGTKYHKVEIEVGGRTMTLETGGLAQQADGAVVVRHGDTMALITAVASDEPREGIDFFPLTVEYREKAYAAGKIPGGFFKREGRPSEKEILSARLTDRPLRPLFPMGFRNEVQVIVWVLSADGTNQPDVLSIIGGGAAVALSSIPFDGPVAACRVGHIDGKVVVNPGLDEMAESDLDMMVAGTRDHIVMVEGGGYEVSEEVVAEALSEAQKAIVKIISAIDELVEKAGNPKREVPAVEEDEELVQAVREAAGDDLTEALKTTEKQERRAAISRVKESTIEKLAERFPEKKKAIKSALYDLESETLRRWIVSEKRRVDGRGPKDVREINCDVSSLPRAHGSAMFKRGETQALVATTLGTKIDEQKIDALEGESWKSFMLHYNFPPFSVNETRPIRGTSRREIGHGALAERALSPVIPTEEHFPYTVRLVSDILMSNGSSSMATVCGGSLSLMDAGVPIKSSVAGVAMGLVKEGDEVVVLTDILGDEDHLGDMDFKVAGTREGITAFQMDIKTKGIDAKIMSDALAQAREARHHILDVMDATLASARSELSQYAPRITIIKVETEDIGKIIGPGGKTIRSITERTGAKIDIEDDGTVFIAAVDQDSGRAAEEIIRQMTEKPKVGTVYTGVVRRTTDFGAFVEILPGTDGLLHISELEWRRVEKTEDVVKVGDEVQVKVILVDSDGKVKLSRKQLLPKPEGYVEKRSSDGDKRRRR
jgi:polyribonucleotide nucleotidyltransferase